MAEMLEYVQFDTDPPIVEDLEERDPDTGEWRPMDVTGKTVRLLAENRRTRRRFGGQAVAVPNAENKTRVKYELADDDLSEDGDYIWHWEVSTPSGERRTIPRGGYKELRVQRKLGAVA